MAESYMISSYLKEDLGPVIAKGLAEVSIARPQNPQEYLGLWLLHYVQQRQRRIDEVSSLKALEAMREDWRRARAIKERLASSVIQREWRAHVSIKQAQVREEAALRQLFASVEDSADNEELPEEDVSYALGATATDEDTANEERDLEAERSSYYQAYKRAQLFVNVLEKHHIGALKSMVPDSNKSATRVLRACMYLQGYKANAVSTLDKIKHLIKPFNFVNWMKAYDALHGNPPTMKAASSRARRVLSRVDEDEVKTCSTALHAIYTWVLAAVLYRHSRDEHIKYRLRAGKDVGEDTLEEGEDIEEDTVPEPLAADDIDLDDEEVKQEEEEARLLARAEAERAAEEEAEEHEE